MDHDLDRIAASLDRVADAIVRLAEAQSGQQPMEPAAQASLDLVLHDSQRIARRLGALDALTPPVAAQPKPSA